MAAADRRDERVAAAGGRKEQVAAAAGIEPYEVEGPDGMGGWHDQKRSM